MIPSAVAGLVAFASTMVLPLVNDYHTYQDIHGCVARDVERAFKLLNCLYIFVRTAYMIDKAPIVCSYTFGVDVSSWMTRGVDASPQFDYILSSYVLSSRNTSNFFVTPLTVTNRSTL